MKSSNQKKGGDAETDLYHFPGHLVRRLHQINVGMFHDLLADQNITPVQFGLLLRLTEVDLLDQVTLGAQLGINRTTMGDVILRLEKRGFVSRGNSAGDRRVKLLSITTAGRNLVASAMPSVLKVQELLLAPLNAREKDVFIQLVSKIIEANNGFSRVPITR